MNANYIRDERPSNNRDFNDSANNLWKDNLPFNIFTAEGYMTEEAKKFVIDNREAIEVFKKSNTWADAILDYAEFRELGYQCAKSAPKRSDVSFSESAILNAYVEAEEAGNGDQFLSGKNQYVQNSLVMDKKEGFDIIEELTIESYR